MESQSDPIAGHASSLLDRVGHSPLVGRQRELATALAEMRRALAGEGRVLLISGEPGVGKTRFARELMAEMRASGGTSLSGACYAEGEVPYAPVVRLIRDTVSQRDTPPLAGSIMAGLAALVPDFFTGAENFPQSATLNARVEQQRLFENVIACCEKLCERAPLLLFIDDIQWADSATLFLVRHVARASARLPLLLLLTLRDAGPKASPDLDGVLNDLNRERLAIEFRLGRLGHNETGDLLAAMLSEDIPPEFVTSIYEQTEGNPFFVEEVCKSLIEEGKLVYSDGHWHPPATAELKIPQTVRAAIQERVAKLPARAQDVLRLAAIVGREFDFEILLRAGDFDEPALVGALEDALRAQLIHEVDSGSPSTLTFSFAHGLISSTLRESTIHVRRRMLHRRIAVALEAAHPYDFEALAYHYKEAGDRERVHEYYIKAGDRARACAPEDAARLYRSALDHWPEGRTLERAETLGKLGSCLWVIADHEGALECYKAAYDLYDSLGDRLHAGDAQRMIGRIHWVQADPQTALRHYHQALEMLEQGPETVELARAISSISQMHMLAPLPEQAIAWGERALAMAERLGAEDVAVHALNNIGTSLAQSGEYERGLAMLQASAQRALAIHAPDDACRAYYNLAVELQRECRYAAAEQWLERLCDYASEAYARNFVTLARWRLMWLRWLTGRWGAALDQGDELVNLGHGLYANWTNRVVASMDIDMGRIKEARDSLEQTLPSALQAADMQTTVPHMGEMVRVYGLAGQEAKAMETAAWVLAAVSQLAYPVAECTMPLLFACQWFAQHAAPDPRAGTCLALLEQLNDRLHTEESLAALCEARACLLLADGRPRKAAEGLREAAAAWEMIERRYDQARALASLARAFDMGDDGAASELARVQALAILESLAAQLHDDLRTSFLASPLVTELRQATETPVRRAEQGASGSVTLAGLTEREVEVLRLVAQGLTNAQIAEQLVLSRLTVNAHMRSIFNKLDVTRRTAAARIAIEHGLA